METQKTTNGTSKKKPERKAPKMETVPEAAPEVREIKAYGIRATFGIDLGLEMEDDGETPKKDQNGNTIPREREVTGFAHPGSETPEIDHGYVFPAEETKMILLGLEVKDRILLVGETGTGKSSLIEQIGARLNYNVVKVNFDGAITRNDLVGEVTVKPNPNGVGSITEFQYGILPYAFRMPGTIILLDEWDTISGECSFVLQRPLEKNDGKLLLLENGGELVEMHPLNCIAATANTCGQGDDTGNYTHGTKVQNYAQLNRFSMTIRVNYLPEDKEIEMVSKRFPGLKPDECSTLVKAVNLIREAYKEGQLTAPLSHRDLINWCDKYYRIGDAERAAKYCFLNRMSNTDAEVAQSLIQRSFGDDIKK